MDKNYVVEDSWNLPQQTNQYLYDKWRGRPAIKQSQLGDHRKTFVALEQLDAMHKKQLDFFEQRTKSQEFVAIHSSHYDWWFFPIDERSGHGYKFTVTEEEVEMLKKDLVYMQNLRRGIHLLLFAWGFDSNTNQFVKNPKKGQQWTRYPVRLYKAGRCAQIFGEAKLFDSILTFTRNRVVDNDPNNLDELVFSSSFTGKKENALDLWQLALW